MSALSGDLRDLIEHDQKSARPLLSDLVARLPKSAEARVLLANSYLRSLEAAPALEHYRAAHALDPKNLSIRHQMGLCAVVQGDYEGALGFYREALSLSPQEHSASMAALMLHRLGRPAEAVKAYSDLLSKLKRDREEAPHVLRGAAMLLRDAGAPLAAERYMHELIVAYRANPVRVAAALVERDNSIDFHEWTRYAHKTHLARALARYQQKNPGALRFPATFVLPEDRAGLLEYAAREPSALFIAKPHRGTGGQGIAISRDAVALAARDDVVVQRYVERPYLVDGRKGHIRLYGLVTSLAPLRAYLYRDGIVRFAPDAYDLSEQGLANVHGHVTNTALHRGHPKLEVSNDPAQENSGNVWSLRAFLKRMKADGRDVDHVWTELRALAKGFLAMVAADGLFKRQAKAAPRRAFPPKLFGLDVLVDADGKPWLIEAQRKP
ncbi:CDC27 family protein, partial [Methylocapsa sp. S129]|uniref:CDC27 family protein n=1 Tax=Methylocapsa sp. S129 TaxID=1641869 RepID=UPI00352AD6DB